MSKKTIIEEIERVPGHLTKCLDMLERWESRVSNELDATPEGSAPDSGLARQLSEITKTSTSVAKEMRAWVGKVKEVVDSLSLDDKIKVSINLIQSLSLGDRLKAYNHIRQTELGRDDGGIILSVSQRAPRMMTSGPADVE
jgi:hypothetical protein